MNSEQVVEAYKGATSQWTGCDWKIFFEGDGPSLQNITSEEAMKIYYATTGAESDRWFRAAKWLAKVEEAAREAEQEARIAYGLAVAGYPGSALPHATRAYEIEARYHKTLVWLPFLHAIEAMIDEAGFVCETCGEGADGESVVLPWTMPEQLSQ